MEKNKINKSKTKNLMSNISNSLGNIFQNTFFTPHRLYDDTKYIRDNINKSINDIISHNEDINGEVNMANLYNRLTSDDTSKTKLNDEVFGAKQVTDSMMSNFIQNRQLIEYENQIDTIIKYMPILQDTLNVKKDHVLCADHYTRDFINVTDEISGLNSSEQDTTFNKKIKYIKEKYNLITEIDKYYDKASKYGECFIYIIGYNEALQRLMKNKSNVKNGICNENATTLYSENIITVNEYTDYLIENDITHTDYLQEDGTIGVSINMGVLESAIKSTEKFNILSEAANSLSNVATHQTVPDKLGFEGISQDGLIGVNKKAEKQYENPSLDIRGCIMKELRRENVIPVYIDNICLGYYYIECDLKNQIQNQKKNSFFKGNLANMNSIFGSAVEKDQDNALKFITTKITNMIDSKFINDNSDLKKELYIILKQNNVINNPGSQINISFIPPSDVVHIKFEEDEETHRGLSDLDKSIVPASMYTALLTTNTIGILTRGFDKRVYYVKQRVDTNISGVLLNTINQLQRGNMGSREISNPKTVLRVTGRYNDHVIPVGPSGDSPVSIENLPGQDIDTKQDLMETLKEQTIGPSDVPLDYVDQTKQVDFATRLTMSSYKFLRSIYKRQGKTNIFLSIIIQKLWEYEFPIDDENSEKVKLKVQLPTPAYLDQMAVGEVFRVTNDYSMALAETEYVDDNDPLVSIKKKLFINKHNKAIMGSQIDQELIDKIKVSVDMEAKLYSEQESV